jgi:DNA-binding Lrp family transcriptional regulator
VAAIVSAQSGVNHNYEREHRYNLWFVATGAGAAEVQRALCDIEDRTGLPVLRLPLVEEFHIDLGFDVNTREAPRGSFPIDRTPLSEMEKALVGAVAPGLPLVARPYRDLAETLGTSEEQVISLLGGMLAGGRIRRIGAVIRHRRVGYDANAMVVWDVPDELAGDLGRRLARDAAVTLCYRRSRALPEWPFNLYCMVHGRSRGRVLYEVKRMSALHGLVPFARSVLFSRRCFAQRAARYG